MKIKNTGAKFTLSEKGADLSLWVRVDRCCLGAITIKLLVSKKREKSRKIRKNRCFFGLFDNDSRLRYLYSSAYGGHTIFVATKKLRQTKSTRFSGLVLFCYRFFSGLQPVVLIFRM